MQIFKKFNNKNFEHKVEEVYKTWAQKQNQFGEVSYRVSQFLPAKKSTSPFTKFKSASVDGITDSFSWRFTNKDKRTWRQKKQTPNITNKYKKEARTHAQGG